MKSVSKTLFALYLLFLLWLVLFKFSIHLSSAFDQQTRNLNVIPFTDFSRKSLQEMAYNVVAFIPFGLLLSVHLKRATFWRKLAVIFLFSFAAELTQFVFAIGVTDITDMITNTSGGFLGLILYDLSSRYGDNEKLDRFIVVAGTIFLTVCIVLLGVLLPRNVRYNRPARGTPGASLSQTLSGNAPGSSFSSLPYATSHQTPQSPHGQMPELQRPGGRVLA